MSLLINEKRSQSLAEDIEKFINQGGEIKRLDGVGHKPRPQHRKIQPENQLQHYRRGVRAAMLKTLRNGVSYEAMYKAAGFKTIVSIETIERDYFCVRTPNSHYTAIERALRKLGVK